MECPICFEKKPTSCFPQISTCPHRSCSTCLREYLRTEIMESRVVISCPECPVQLHPNDIELILQDDVLMRKYNRFMMRHVLAKCPDAHWCPAPDCDFVILGNNGRGVIECQREGCGTIFCADCSQVWHPGLKCEEARKEREGPMNLVDNIRPCPRCGVLIEKKNDGHCNHMKCTVCKYSFCWLCMKEANELHFLGGSGCSYWARKYSRKKKILCKLSALLWAPIAISLVAGIGVPAFILGFPVWAGRETYSRFKEKSRMKRGLATVGAVTLSLPAGTIIAGLTLIYGVSSTVIRVYLLNPISLCREECCSRKKPNSARVVMEELEKNERPGSSRDNGSEPNTQVSGEFKQTYPIERR